MTTETISSDRTTAAPNGVRFVIRRQYNSAWPEVERSRLARSSDLTMNTNDGSRAPLELRAFIDGIPALAWFTLPDGSPEFVNKRLQDYTGLSPDQLYGEWKSILHRDEVEDFENCRLSWFRRSLGRQNFVCVASTESIAGSSYQRPFHDDQGNLVRWCGINTDVDDRKRAEQKLRQN